MLTTLTGIETEADKGVIAALEDHFGNPVVYFHAIQQPADDKDGYWHVRVKTLSGVIFVRQNGIGELRVYGPVNSVVVN